MFQLQVTCPCGFKSEIGPLGPASLFDQTRMAYPVYQPSSGSMLTHWFDSEQLRINPEDFDKWISAHGDAVIHDLYSPDAQLTRFSYPDSPHLWC